MLNAYGGRKLPAREDFRSSAFRYDPIFFSKLPIWATRPLDLTPILVQPRSAGSAGSRLSAKRCRGSVCRVSLASLLALTWIGRVAPSANARRLAPRSRASSVCRAVLPAPWREHLQRVHLAGRVLPAADATLFAHAAQHGE